MLTESLFSMPAGVQTRWASPENPRAERGAGAQANAGRKGRPCLPVPAGAQIVLAEAAGTSGVIRRIWATINDRSTMMLRGLRLDIYWDNAATPAVSAPFGDFFGQCLGRCQTFESALFSNPEGRSFNCSVPMPFKSGFKIVLTNETSTDLAMLFYDVDFTIGDKFDESTLYLHTHWRRENPTTQQKDYELLPKLAGRGRFLGCNVGVIVNTKTYGTAWWGEGEVMVYLDGDEAHPTLAGTGTEDYIGTAWGQGQYAHAYQGCHLADREAWQFAFYRHHVLDPVFFQRDIRVTIHQIGCWNWKTFQEARKLGAQLIVAGPGRKPFDMEKDGAEGTWGLFEREDDWSSCSYFYLDRPENGLPPLAPIAERTAGLFTESKPASVLA